MKFWNKAHGETLEEDIRMCFACQESKEFLIVQYPRGQHIVGQRPLFYHQEVTIGLPF